MISCLSLDVLNFFLFYFLNKNWHEYSEQPPTMLARLAMWFLLQQAIGKILKRTRREWEKSTDGGVGGVSVSFVGREGERKKERTSLPTFTQCACRSRFLFTPVTMQWAPFLPSIRNCFPCQSKEAEMKAGCMKAYALVYLTCLNYILSKGQSSRSENVKHEHSHTKTPECTCLQYTVAV